MAYSIHRHIKFNTWANTAFAEVLRAVPDSIYFLETKSSFPSIAKTVLHIRGAQEIWLSRLNGVGLGAWPSGDFENDKNKTLEGLVKSSRDIEQYTSSKDDAFLATTYAYKNMAGQPFEDSYEETLFHIVNHGTYHRGQIVTMLRQAGITTLVSTDLIHYLRTIKTAGDPES